MRGAKAKAYDAKALRQAVPNFSLPLRTGLPTKAGQGILGSEGHPLFRRRGLSLDPANPIFA